MKLHEYLKIILGTVFLLVISNCLCAKEAEHIVRGWVLDNMNGASMSNVHVILMNSDSTVIDTMTIISDSKDKGSFLFKIYKVGKYIVKADCIGYDTGYCTFELISNRQNSVYADVIRMKKNNTMLPELIVKATKIKMVFQGDTIVYNANAFNLAEGSMLDALVSKLPGTKLTKDGRILVNGKYIQSLLVDGRDFFNGNPKMALENIPSYVVNKIKVYDKAGIASKLTGRDMDDKIYVMDVRLKKEYTVGYIGNIEAGTGSKNRYQTRIFGMKFSEISQMMIFGNLNNLNDNQRAELSGDWSPTDKLDGLQATKKGGFSFVKGVNGAEGSSFSTSNDISHIDGENQSVTSSQIFLPDGDSYQKSVDNKKTKSTSFNSYNEYNYVGKSFYLTEDLNLNYAKSHDIGNSSLAVTNEDNLLNQLLTKNNSEKETFSVQLWQQGGKTIFIDMLRWSNLFCYERIKSKEFSLKDVEYTNDAYSKDHRNNYLDNSSKHFETIQRLYYEYCLHKMSIIPSYTYTYKFDKTNNFLYRLDHLENTDSTRFDLLPSTVDALTNVMDKNNSYLYRDYQNIHEFALTMIGREKWIGKNSRWRLEFPLRLMSNNLDYDRKGMQYVSKKTIFFEPKISIYHTTDQTCKIGWDLSIDIKSDIPDLTTMVNFQDDSDPQNIRLGNPDLKNIHYYDFDLKMDTKGNHQRAFNLSLDYHKQDNAVAYNTIFNKNTGIYTIKPVSVKGNWNTNTKFGYTCVLDQKEKFTIDNQLGLHYNRNVDMASVEGWVESQRSIVNNYHFDNVLKVNYRLNDNYEFSLHLSGNYWLINSDREGFSNISAGDYNLGLNTQMKLLCHLQFLTDISMFVRRGYQESQMNTTDWIWNAQLVRDFFKGHMLVKLQAFDILNQLSCTQFMVNAQGRTESWNNSIPRYLMLSLSWKFNINPKNNRPSKEQ